MNISEKKYFNMEKLSKFKFTILIIAFLFGINSQAQQFKSERFVNDYKWKISLQTNISDFDFSFEKPINTSNWNVLPYPSKISLERYLTYNLFIEASGSVNKIKEGTSVNRRVAIDDLNVLNADLHLKYSFGGLFNFKFVDPYIASGFGYMQLNKENKPTYNLGIGINLWLGDFKFMKSSQYTRDSYGSRFGINIEALGKKDLTPNVASNILTITAGVFYMF